MIIILYIFVSFMVGLMGRRKKLGFWGYFFGSLLMTPIMGFILLTASYKKAPGEKK